MEVQLKDAITPIPRVRVTLQLGSESYSVNAEQGILSDRLVSIKEQSMSILKEYITKHNVPTKHNVLDEPLEGSSDDIVEDIESPVELPHAKKRK